MCVWGGGVCAFKSMFVCIRVHVKARGSSAGGKSKITILADLVSGKGIFWFIVDA